MSASNANTVDLMGGAVRSELWNLPQSGGPRLRALLARAFRRRCPLCNAKGIFKNWFTLYERCPTCNYLYARESGYFLGAYPLNLVAAELIPVLAMVALLVWTDISWILLEVILIPMAVGLPFLFFPFAQMIWLAIDLFITPVNQR